MKPNFENNELIDFCKEAIVDWLEDHRGQDLLLYGSDFPMQITMDDYNINGKAFVYEEDSQKAFDMWYPKWAVLFNQYMLDVYNRPVETRFNYVYTTGEYKPIDVEVEVCNLVIWMCYEICTRLTEVENHWNGRVEFTEDVIDEMIVEVNDFSEEDLINIL